ncbi:MAG: transglycosylase SLT domain-containing protein [Sandaracinaceae bacterium]
MRSNVPSTHAARLSVGFAATAFILATTVITTAQAPEDDPTLSALARALDRRMTVWSAGERVIYVSHCRAARGGCRQRVATFSRLIDRASRDNDLDPFLLAAVAVRESGMDPQATGAAGERGIVQLHPRGTGSSIRFVQNESYRRRCARRPGHCQAEVLEAGARLLASSIRRCGGVREGLGAYNRGECGATDYSRRVMIERQRLLRLTKSEGARSIHDID